MKTYQLLIDGKLRAAAETFAVVNPATEEVIAQCPIATEADLDEAVAAARKAQPGWAARSLADRQAVIRGLGELIESNREELQALITAEQGKPLADASMEIDVAIGYIQYFSGLDIPIRVIEDNEAHLVEEHNKPLGVVAGIVPWNFPFVLAIGKLAPALLAGNALILKPAPTTPLSALRFADLAKDSLPAGLFQLLTDNGGLGPKITAHPGIDKISFTGSVATGKAIVKSGAETLKRNTLELGGNDASIVLDDIDLDTVVPQLFTYAFANCGQVCVAIKRLYIPDSIYEEVCERFTALAEAVKVGDGTHEGVGMGPVQNKMQFERIMSLIDEVKAGAGTIIAGGERVGDRGYFVRPTVVRDIAEGTTLVDQEAFGPIRPLIRYTDLDEVIERSNATRYGLGGSVWSSNPEKARDVAQRMTSGTIWVNQHMALAAHLPFRGIKESGVGTEGSEEGLLEFTAPQVINFAKAS